MTKNDYILFKALAISTYIHTDFFLKVIEDILASKDNKKSHVFFKDDDPSVEYRYIQEELDKRFPKYIWIKFSDNDFRSNILFACEEFHSQYSDTEHLYEMYARLAEANISPEDYIGNYILQNSYANHIGGTYRFGEVQLKPIDSDNKLFNYLKNNIKVKLVDYVPDEISGFNRNAPGAYPSNFKYYYENECWNGESCFIAFSPAPSIFTARIL